MAGGLTDPGTALFHVIEDLPYGRVVRAIRTAVNNWVGANGTREVPKDWFDLEFTGLLEDRGAAALAVAAPAVETQDIVPTYLLEEKAVRVYLMLAQNTEGPLAERAEIAPNNPDDMPIEWFKEWIRWIDKHI